MKQLNIIGSKLTPKVSYNEKESLLEIIGNSIPEDSFSFYNPILKWLDELKETPPKKISIKIQIEYFNTSSSKYILEILKRIEKISLNCSCDVNVYWFYDDDDEDMQEVGENYKSMVKIPIILKPFKSSDNK